MSFDHICYRRHDSSAFLYAFDLIELNDDDFRRDPLEGAVMCDPRPDAATAVREAFVVRVEHHPAKIRGVGHPASIKLAWNV